MASHWRHYKASNERIDRINNYPEEIYDIRHILKRKRIPGFKLNHSLQSFVQNASCFHMYIEFSRDCKYMTITNRKPQLQAERG